MRFISAMCGMLLAALHINATHHKRHHENSHHEISHHRRRALSSRTDPLVFAHYMITFQPPNGDYSHDIAAAKAAGIDAFAVNYGGWGCSWPQLAGFLEAFYEDAASQNFKLFMSYDTTVMTDPNMMVNISNTYAHHKAQLWVDGMIFLSSFSTNPPAFNWQTDVLDKIDAPVMFMPGDISQSASSVASLNVGSGHFTWIHPASSISQEAAIDSDFSSERKVASKPWMAGIAPWFFKRMDADMNWLHAQDSGIWFDRWLHLLQLQPNFIELVTWNDFGESSYVGPVNSFMANQQAQDDCFYGGLDHSAFLSMAKLFIQNFKNGVTDKLTIAPEDEDVFFFYRLQPAEVNGREDSLPLPKNVTDIADNVYILSFLAEDATVTLNSGGTVTNIPCKRGVFKSEVPFTLGEQSLTMNRPLGSGKTLSKTGPAISGQLNKYQGNVVAL